MVLIRPQAWWYNKVPLSVLLVSILIADQPLTLASFGSLALVVLIVSCAANYGYGLNELYDRSEDARGGRANVANDRGVKIVWIATVASALIALVFAFVGAGLLGLVATGIELLLPATYSIPPIRTKERGWFAVLSDALAAHVYPAVLAMIIIAHQGIRVFEPILIASVLVWAIATGLRGIISHLVWSLDHDRSVGLTTLTHSWGGWRLTMLILMVLLPLEIMSFALLLILTEPGLLLAVFVVVFLANELRRVFSPRARKAFNSSYHGRVFRPVTNRYVPFVDEMFYKVWGSLFVALSAALATKSPALVIIAVLYVALFWRHFRGLLWRNI